MKDVSELQPMLHNTKLSKEDRELAQDMLERRVHQLLSSELSQINSEPESSAATTHNA